MEPFFVFQIILCKSGIISSISSAHFRSLSACLNDNMDMNDYMASYQSNLWVN